MKIGLISDSHNETKMLKYVANMFECLGIDTVIHCGDVTDAKEINVLKRFKLYLAYGNSDLNYSSFAEKITQFNNKSQSGRFLDLLINEKRIFVIHGDDRRKFIDAIQRKCYDYIFCGHSHKISDKKIGNTRIINPGALAGRYGSQSTFAVIDLETDKLERFYIE